MAHIQEFVTQNPDKKILIFTETKDDAKQFEKSNYANFLSIHGDLEQKQREFALNKFKNDSSVILVGTDVAARGIDVDDIDVVI